MIHYLYEVTRDDGLRYIGVTVDPIRREWQHKNGYGSTELKNRAFSLKVLAAGPEFYIYELEEYFIHKHSPELNKMRGGRCGSAHSGTKNGRALVGEKDVYDIRVFYATGDYTQEELASNYGLSRQAIGYIVTGESWTNVGGPLTFKVKRVPKETREQIRELYKTVSITEIANKLNIKWQTAYSYAKGTYV